MGIPASLTRDHFGPVRRLHRSLFVLLALALIFASFPISADVRAAAPDSYYVDTTGHFLGQPFLDFWLERDGMRTLGDPVTEVVTRDGRLAQYFQYGGLIRQSDGSVSRLKLGGELLQAQHNPDAVTSTSRRVGSARETTSHTAFVMQLSSPSTISERLYPVSSHILAYYDSHGGRNYFGKSLSNAYQSGNRLIQWFEFGRIESSGGEARLAPVGLEMAWSLGLDTTATQRGNALLFDPTRYRSFTGDGVVANATGPFIPSRIAIPKIKVDTKIESVGIVSGVMGVPRDPWNVGWYPSISSPGEYTNVVMAGHRDWFGIGPVIFWNLYQLVPGDKIYVTGRDGDGATYVVTTSWLVDAQSDANELIDDTGFEALTLITCGGKWNGTVYESRLVVRAERI